MAEALNITKENKNFDGFGRFREGGYCDKIHKNFFVGFSAKTQDSFFYVNVLQFAIVTLMYVNVGKGRYWKILFYAALAGFLGSLVENGTVAYTCAENDKNVPRFTIVPFLMAEVFWIVEEYSVPFLNLTKMKAFSKGKATKLINYIIFGLFILFCCFRFCIGYYRMSSGLLGTPKTKIFHSYAFGVMALADLICTFGILYYVKKHNQQEAIKTSNINHYIKRSSYIILVCVDIVGVCLSVFNFAIEKVGIPDEYLTPFHCVKCSFTLILACDALLFKYSVNTSSLHESSGNYRYGDSYNYSSSNYKSFNKSRNNYNIDISNKSQNGKLSNITPYNYPSLDYGKMDSGNYQTKSIIKNYTNIKPSPSSTAYDPTSPESDKTYQSQQFGFLYSKDY